MLKVKIPMAASLLRVGGTDGLSLVDEYLAAANGPAHPRRTESRYHRSAGTRGTRERAPCVGCSRMLYGPSNTATSETETCAHDSDVRITTGRRADERHAHADVADDAAVAPRPSARRRETPRAESDAGHAMNCAKPAKHHPGATAPLFYREPRQLVARVWPERSNDPEYQEDPELGAVRITHCGSPAAAAHRRFESACSRRGRRRVQPLLCGRTPRMPIRRGETEDTSGRRPVRTLPRTTTQRGRAPSSGRCRSPRKQVRAPRRFRSPRFVGALLLISQQWR